MKNEEPKRRSKAKKWRAKLDTVCLINQGWTRDNIMLKLQEDYDYTESSAQSLYYEALQDAKKSVEDYIHEAAKINVQRLVSITDAAFAEKRYGDCLRAIDTLNRMGGLYAPEKVDVTSNDEPIKISFE